VALLLITKEVIMQTKVNSVAIRATNATGAGRTSTLKMGDKIIVTVTLSETVVVTGEPTYTPTWRFL
jgi:protoporphyrinogen oxidase